MREAIDVGLPPLKQPFSWMVRAGAVLYTAHGPVRSDGSIDTGPIEQQARIIPRHPDKFHRPLRVRQPERCLA